MAGEGLFGDAGVGPDTAATTGQWWDRSPDHVGGDIVLGGDAVPGETAASAPVASAGHPLFARVGQRVYLDGSGSTVPSGCSLTWKPDPANPGTSTLSHADHPMLKVSVSNPGVYRYFARVGCPGKSDTDVTAIYAFARSVAAFAETPFVYREKSVAGDNSATGPKGRRYVFERARHPAVIGAPKEVWIDVLGKRLKMKMTGAGTFTRWVQGASQHDERSYWAFVDHDRYARAPVPRVRVEQTAFTHSFKISASAPLHQSFGGQAVFHELLAHPRNPTAPAISRGAAGEFLVTGKMTSPHLFYVVTEGQKYRSPPALITLPLPAAKPARPDLGVIYQVYLRQFADGDGDGVGDLAGLRAKLKYLAHDLGVDTVLLMSIFASPGKVGLRSVPSDLSRIHPDYGTNKGLGKLLRQAHALGLRVLLDLPLEQVHSSFGPFVKAEGNPASPTSGWFHMFQDNTTWFSAGFQGVGAGSGFFAPGRRPAVAVNLDHPNARAAMIDAAVALLDLDGDGKLDDGADGFRLTHRGGPLRDFWRQLAGNLGPVAPGAVLMGQRDGEADELGQLLQEAGVGAVMDTPFYHAARRALRTHRAQGLYAHLGDALKHTLKRGVAIPHATGDAGRLITSLAGEGFGVAQAAATLALTAPGCPLLLAGDEIGLMAQGGSDPERRYGGAFLWGAKDPHQTGEPGGGPLNKPKPLAQQVADPYSLFSHYRALIKVRRQALPLRTPGAPGYHYSEFSDPGVFAMVRQWGKERVLVVVNLTASFKLVSFSERSKSTLLYRVGYGSGSTLGPYGTHIYRLP